MPPEGQVPPRHLSMPVHEGEELHSIGACVVLGTQTLREEACRRRDAPLPARVSVFGMLGGVRDRLDGRLPWYATGNEGREVTRRRHVRRKHSVALAYLLREPLPSPVAQGNDGHAEIESGVHDSFRVTGAREHG